MPAAPSITALTLDSTRIKLTFGFVAGTTKYKLSRALASAGPYTEINANITDFTFIDTGLTKNTKFFYKAKSNDD